MFGKLHYSPDEYYRMSFEDTIIAIEGYQDAEMSELNRMRHLMWAPLAAMGAKISPKEIMPLPMDGDRKEIKPSMSKEQFLTLANKYRPK